MTEDLYLEIITPEEIIYEGPVGLVQVPGSSGNFTLLKRHAPIISTLQKGKIRVIGKDGVEKFFHCEGGLLECQENRLIILINRIL
ncbi:ATP synthase F1 subunit epsilon [Marinilabiliaceae bacterium JC017]|nr:ATP synthase F1 subunit epsilon [Marinilabiliaceae bacterium JC017]